MHDMIVRKNTKAFKTILQLVTDCQDRPDREKLIRLYITKAGQSIRERINIEGIEGGAALFYEMTYQTVLNNLKSPNHQLHESDEVPGIYFFHSSSNKVWDETPFEFDESIKEEFRSLQELPKVRKKEKAQKFVFPAPDSPKARPGPAASPEGRKSSTKETRSAERSDRNSKSILKDAKTSADAEKKGPAQPNFKLKHEIEFTNLGRIVFRQPQLSKRDILEYYNKIAEHLLPYVKDRLMWTRLGSDGSGPIVRISSRALFENDEETTPDWIKTVKVSGGNGGEPLLICNDREHLLLCVEAGCVEFSPCHSKVKNLHSPDYIAIAIDSSESELGKAIDVALVARQILDGLKLPSFVKTDGISGLHVYVPLDSKSDFETSRTAAEYLGKLMRLKVPDLITFKGSEGYVHGKVSVDFSLNKEEGSVIAPYSLAGQSANVATPLVWDEVKEGLRVEDFNYETIFTRLKKDSDPFDSLFRKRVNADTLVERIVEHYSFLFS